MQFQAPSSFGPIQVIPPGLIGFLNLKHAGEAPHSLLAEYRPIIDTTEWLYQADALDWVASVGSGAQAQRTFNAIGGGGAAFATAGGTALQVPTNQMWWIHELTVVAATAAGEALTASLAWHRNNVAGWYSLSPPVTVGASQVFTVGARGFFLPPGAVPSLVVHQITTAGTILVSCPCRFTPLPL